MLGDPSAPLTVTEYVDLQCPVCAAAARDTLPALVRDYVRTGKAKLDARTLHFIGPDSERAARVAAGAERQGKLWPFLEAFYAAQGQENSGYVTDAFLRSVAAAAGVDAEAALEFADSAAAQERLNRANADAQRLGIDSHADVHRRARGRQAATVLAAHDPQSLAAALDAMSAPRMSAAARCARRRPPSRPPGSASRRTSRSCTTPAARRCARSRTAARPSSSPAYAELGGVPVALLGLARLRRDPRLARARRGGGADGHGVPGARRLRLLGLADLRRGRAARRDLHLVRRLGGLHDAARRAVGHADAQRAAARPSGVSVKTAGADVEQTPSGPQSGPGRRAHPAARDGVVDAPSPARRARARRAARAARRASPGRRAARAGRRAVRAWPSNKCGEAV